LIHPEIDPVIVQFGPLAVRWYGLMYLIGFIGGWWLGRLRARGGHAVMSEEAVNDLVFYVAMGVVLGGRLGYALFYNLPGVLADPLSLLRIWEGGMSFHGGLLGVLVAMALFARRQGLGFFQVTDFVAPLVTIGLGAGRIGNFINGELWGRTTDLPWGMVFRGYGAGPLPRHPSQLYEAFLEGLVMFILLWVFSSKPRPTMAVSGLFLLLYGLFRFAVEFVREPDLHLGFLALDWVTMGQLLSAPMILLGVAFIWWAYRTRGGL
jgi:phosphatidylglycerol:prolipoprotein diacylglycerol transferase